jgi:hypothetical protein
MWIMIPPDEEGFYSCVDPMVLLKKKIIKANKELASLLDRPEQTPERQRKDQAPYVTT